MEHSGQWEVRAAEVFLYLERAKEENSFLSSVKHGCASDVMPETARAVRTLTEQLYQHAEPGVNCP